MYGFVRAIGLVLTLLLGLLTFAVAADAPSAGITRQLVGMSPLANVPGHTLTAVTLELAPGVSLPSHTHAGFVFVYVLEGTVRSQLDSDAAVDFSTGESWIEPPGTVHALTHNPSSTEKAKVLAVFVAKDGAKLTNYPESHQ